MEKPYTPDGSASCRPSGPSEVIGPDFLYVLLYALRYP